MRNQNRKLAGSQKNVSQNREMVLCNNQEGWEGEGGGWEVQEGGTYVYQWLIHVDVWQKPTQYCKPIILQLKISFKKHKQQGSTA